jgi:hypothetical protein
MEAMLLGQCVRRMDSRSTVLCHAQLYHDRATHLKNSQATRGLLACFSCDPRYQPDTPQMVAAPIGGVLTVARLAALGRFKHLC